MRRVSKIFKLLISKGFYPQRAFMCHAVEVARDQGVISTEEALACVESIQSVMYEIHAQQQNPYRTSPDTVMHIQISSHPVRNAIMAFRTASNRRTSTGPAFCQANHIGYVRGLG